jgi:hypothetical protein
LAERTNNRVLRPLIYNTFITIVFQKKRNNKPRSWLVEEYMNSKGETQLYILGIIAVVAIASMVLFTHRSTPTYTDIPDTEAHFAGNAVRVATTPECKDGADNDGDGKTDYSADAGCTSKNDADESNCGDLVCEGGETPASCAIDCVTQCNDRQDNDADGRVDLNDMGCSNVADTDERNCGDGVCSANEDYNTCGADCPRPIVCGNGLCEVGESETCASDCGPVCGNGICEPNETSASCAFDCDTCSDTDGGYQPYLQGTVSGVNSGWPFSGTDFCAGDTVVEYYCTGQHWATGNFTCGGNSTGCSNGACIW